MNAIPLRLVEGSPLADFHARINDVILALGGIQSLLEARDALLDDKQNELLPVFSGAAMLVRLCEGQLLDIADDIRELQEAGRL